MKTKLFLVGLHVLISTTALQGMDEFQDQDFVVVPSEPELPELDDFFMVEESEPVHVEKQPDEPQPDRFSRFHTTASTSFTEKETFHSSYQPFEDNLKTYSSLGIFDGRLGSSTAQYAQAKIIKLIKYYLANQGIKGAINKAFKQIQNEVPDGNGAGTSVLLSIFETSFTTNDYKLHIVHAGDSGAVLQTKKSTNILTNPHLPNENTISCERSSRKNVDVQLYTTKKLLIQRLEEYDSGCNSVSTRPTQEFYMLAQQNKMIATTRGIGHKKFAPFFKAEPEIHTRTLTGDERFLILGNNEFWDAISPSAAVNMVEEIINKRRIENLNEANIAQALVTKARTYAQTRTDIYARKDNIIATVVLFLENLWLHRYQE